MTNDSFLIYRGDEKLVVRGYTTASFQIDKDDLVSQSGFVFCLNRDAISWNGSQQEIVVDSTLNICKVRIMINLQTHGQKAFIAVKALMSY